MRRFTVAGHVQAIKAHAVSQPRRNAIMNAGRDDQAGLLQTEAAGPGGHCAAVDGFDAAIMARGFRLAKRRNPISCDRTRDRTVLAAVALLVIPRRRESNRALRAIW